MNNYQYKMEVFNELILMWTLAIMMCFTPWLPDVEIRMIIGFIACGIIVFHFIVNLSLMFAANCRNIRKSMRLKRARKKLNKQRKINLKRLDLVRDGRRERRLELDRKLAKKMRRDMRKLEDLSSSSDDECQEKREDVKRVNKPY